MKKIFLALIFLSMVTFGFFQENIKVAINFQIDYLTRFPQIQSLSGENREAAIAKLAPVSNIDYYYNHPRFHVLSSLTRGQLIGLKWAHTVVFTLVYLLLNLLAAKVWTGASFLRPIGLFYLGLFFMALMVYAMGILIGYQSQFYGVSRKIIGVLQSPLPVLITWLTQRLRTNLSNQE